MTDFGLHKRPGRRRQADSGMRAVKFIVGILIAPPLLLIEAWRTKDERYSHWLLTALITIYGSTIGIAYDPTGAGSDGVRHLLSVYNHYVGLSFEQFLRESYQILSLQLTTAPKEDLYIHVVSYLVGGILGLPGLFFTVVAFVYGYFFTGSLLIIFRGWRRARLPLVTLFLIANFFLIKNIEGVNTVRTWTGLWVLVYACLQYYQTKKWRYLFLMVAPPLIHFGYFVMALPAYAVLLFGNRVVLYSLVFVASSTTTFVNPGTFADLASRSELAEHRFRIYQRDDVANADIVFEQSRQSGNRIWLSLQRSGVQKWALNVFVYTLLLTGIYMMTMDAFQKRIFSVGLLTLTLSNSLWYIYAVSNRAWVIGAVFIGAAFIMTRLQQTSGFRVPAFRSLYAPGIYLSALLFVPYFAYNLSTLLDFPSVFMLGVPFVVWFDPSLNMTLKEALRELLFAVL